MKSFRIAALALVACVCLAGCAGGVNPLTKYAPDVPLAGSADGFGFAYDPTNGLDLHVPVSALKKGNTVPAPSAPVSPQLVK